MIKKLKLKLRNQIELKTKYSGMKVIIISRHFARVNFALRPLRPYVSLGTKEIVEGESLLSDVFVVDRSPNKP